MSESNGNGICDQEFVIPLIYTSKGNVPVNDLTYSEKWEIGTETIICAEFWHDEYGELVKNNVHMYSINGLPAIGAAQVQMQ